MYVNKAVGAESEIDLLKHTLDYENPQLNVFSLLMSVFDTQYTALGTASILVEDRNDPPLLLPSSLSVNENSPPGTVVGPVRAFDEDFNDTDRFSILAEYPPPIPDPWHHEYGLP